MALDHDRCYAAVRARDPRFDGRFFTGVTSTGIFCRPVCPARTPQARNVRFYPSSAAALAAGFRPCRRCRPDTAPGSPAWRGADVVVERALAAIDRGQLDDGATTTALAARLGVSGRHLSRLFAEHVGTTPTRVARARRVLLAHRLLLDTDLPIAEVAFASGFGSVRQFNAVMRDDLGLPPRAVRARRARAPREQRLVLRLHVRVRPPFAFDRLLGFLRPRALPGVEHVTEDTWQRRLDDGEIRIRAVPDGLRVAVDLADGRRLRDVLAAVRHLTDADSDPLEVDEHLAAAHPWLRARIAAVPGMRVPGPWDVWETAARVVLGQQVSVPAATGLAGQLAHAAGGRFPSADELARSDLLDGLGMPGARRAALRGLAAAVADGTIDLLDDPAVVRRGLRVLPGIGPWTADVIALRALRDPDVLPTTDLGVRHALAAAGLEASDLATAAPWRSYVTTHLWDHLIGAPA